MRKIDFWQKNFLRQKISFSPLGVGSSPARGDILQSDYIRILYFSAFLLKLECLQPFFDKKNFFWYLKFVLVFGPGFETGQGRHFSEICKKNFFFGKIFSWSYLTKNRCISVEFAVSSSSCLSFRNSTCLCTLSQFLLSSCIFSYCCAPWPLISVYTLNKITAPEFNVLFISNICLSIIIENTCVFTCHADFRILIKCVN